MKAAPTATERKALLLGNADVSTWVKDRSRPGTAATQLDHLRIFLDRTGLDVDRLEQLAREDVRKLKNVVIDFVREEQGRGLKAKYVGNIWWSVRSFLRSVGVAPDWNPRVEDKESDEDNSSRVVPTHEQVRQIADAVKSARDRMVVHILASSGVRIGTFAVQSGEADGLRLKNLIDLELDPEPHFESKVPMLRVPAFLAKGKAGYYTGLTLDAADVTLAYLRERLHRGEKLTPESPLVAPDPRQHHESRKSKDGYSFIVRKSLGARVQAAMDAVAPKGIRWTPHALRAFASTQLETCEARGLVSRTRREYFLGHALGSVDSLYNLGRPLSPEKVEELRASYAKCLPMLSLTGRRDEVDVKRELLESLSKAIEEATGKKSGDRGTLSTDDLLAALKRSLQGATEGGSKPTSAASTPSTPPTHPRPIQRVVSAGELEHLLGEGWRAVMTVGNRVVVESTIGTVA